MLEQLTPEVRHELAAARVAALTRSAERRPAGRLRRTVGSGLVRLGLRLGYDGSVPPLVTQLTRREEAPSGASSRPITPAADRHVATVSESDIERELAAPFGIRVARLRT
jgi:hypothetical protein